MSDIKAITFNKNSFSSRAIYYSKKYKIPVKHEKLKEPYLEIAEESKLYANKGFLTNLYHKDQFSRRIANYQREKHLKKAIGFKSSISKKILDGTGGLGHDAFIFALLGQEVTIVEKNIGLCILIEEAINNLPDTSYFNSAKDKITILNGDSRKYLDQIQDFDVIYLDPMFNSTKNIARTKNLSFINGYLEDYDNPLDDFLSTDYKRVVIKKELKAPYGNLKEPTVSFKGASIRFDVYTKGEKL